MMTTANQTDLGSTLAEASRAASAELHKQGTPEYDARVHQRAVERERRAADAARDEGRAPADGE